MGNARLVTRSHLATVVKQLFYRFCYQKTKTFKESDATQNDFLSVLCHVVDRVPAKEGDVSLQQALRVVHSSDGRALNDEAIEVWTETEKTLFRQRSHQEYHASKYSP
jgi:ATP-dependent RNA helicase DDX60